MEATKHINAEEVNPRTIRKSFETLIHTIHEIRWQSIKFYQKW